MGRYQEAKEIYAKYGIDTEKAIEELKNIPISLHCWQGDDVIGFDGSDSLSGGIQTTGNYPGRARTPEELMADIAKAASLMPGKKRLNLHASYALLGEDKGKVDRDQYSYKYFEPWIKFAKEQGFEGVDFNPTFFAHPKMKDGLSLSSPDEATRRFWIEHGKRSLEIAAEIGKAFGNKCFVNIWIPDGMKDIPADRLGPRIRLRDSIDEILTVLDKEHVQVAVESKVFGIGVESYTVGSGDFYMNYAATRGIFCLIDNGHYHPTENVADKYSSLLAFYDNIAVHLTRSVRWDSDHMVTFDDTMKDICAEIVKYGMSHKFIIATDWFDASINRIYAWVGGVRAIQKSLLLGLLTPWKEMIEAEEKGDFTKRLYLSERNKMLPLEDVWNEYLKRQGLEEEFFDEITSYEKEVLLKR